MGETWRSRYPITSFIRQAMLRKIGESGHSALSHEERILLVASTFWSATARGELHAWFRSNPERRIRDAIHALTRLGAIRLAGIVRAASAQITRSELEEDFASIEESLLRSDDQLEELMARYAAHAGRSSERDQLLEDARPV